MNPWRRYDSSLGPIAYRTDSAGALTDLRFEDRAAEAEGDPAVEAQLNDYFAGRRQTFDLPLAPGGTEFQNAVWGALVAIPYGETTSYGALASALGKPGAARAVGRANATNPIALVVPCHRVIGSSGDLTGFAYGKDAKRWLLDFEKGRASGGERAKD